MVRDIQPKNRQAASRTVNLQLLALFEVLSDCALVTGFEAAAIGAVNGSFWALLFVNVEFNRGTCEATLGRADDFNHLECR